MTRARLAWAATGLVLCGCSRSSSPEWREANAILITVDTLRADHLECYGSRAIRTPAINRLAADGVRFAQDIAQVPLTLPSHCSLLTGMWPRFTGVQDQAGFSLGPDKPRLASALKSAGFETAAFVASSILNPETGLGQGFDSYTGVSPGTSAAPGSEGLERRGDQVMADALAWIRAHSSHRFFAWIHLFDPHTPYAPPEPYRTQYARTPYDGEIAFVDDVVGRAIDQLRGLRLYEKTLIVLTSDHGEGLGEHGEAAHGFFLYDSTLRVPLIVKFPESRWKSNVVAEQVRGIDVAPTVLQALGVALPPQMQGLSLLAAASGQPSSAPLPAFSETYYPYYHFGWSPLVSLRTATYKYIRAPKPELYDLATDRAELNNLAAGNASRTAGWQQQLNRDYSAAIPAPHRENVDAATLARLKTLGYVGSSTPVRPADAQMLADPKDKIQVYNLLTRALDEADQGKVPESNAHLREVLRRDNRIVDAHLSLGVNLAQMGDAGGAVSSFRNALNLDPRNVIATYNLALAYARQGKLEEAIAGFSRTLELDPHQEHARLDLGRAYQMQGASDAAIAAFRRVIQDNPNSGEAHYLLARVLAQRGLAGEAEAEVRTAARLGYTGQSR
jgi:arylsulfatase A-like enzyme/Tfp pilus assembly protein PilF